MNLQDPRIRILLINAGLLIGLLVAHHNGYHGTNFLIAAVISVVVFNVLGLIGVAVGRKSKPDSIPRNMSVTLWLVIGLLWLVLIAEYACSSKPTGQVSGHVIRSQQR